MTASKVIILTLVHCLLLYCSVDVQCVQENFSFLFSGCSLHSDFLHWMTLKGLALFSEGLTLLVT